MTSIKLMLYDEPGQDQMLIYLLGVRPMDVLSKLPKKLKIRELRLVASGMQEFVYSEDITPKETLKDLLLFFKKHSEYSIDSLSAVLENNVRIDVHDDFETTLILPQKDEFMKAFFKILENYQYDAPHVYESLRNNKNEYLQIQQPDKIREKYATFEEYLKNGSLV
jgi:hypothetical protein